MTTTCKKDAWQTRRILESVIQKFRLPQYLIFRNKKNKKQTVNREDGTVPTLCRHICDTLSHYLPQNTPVFRTFQHFQNDGYNKKQFKNKRMIYKLPLFQLLATTTFQRPEGLWTNYTRARKTLTCIDLSTLRN